VIVTPTYVSKGQGFASYIRACRFIHNVAEGVVVAVPILAGTGDRRTAIVITALSGLSEPVGALMGVWCMKTWFSSWMEATIGFILCVVAGIMIAVSMMELLPQAKLYHSDSAQILQAFLAGCCIIGATLFFL
jgi:ZIP family zinc transporter